MIFEENISDNEIRFLGEFPTQPKKKFPWQLIGIFAAVIVGLSIIIWALKPQPDNNVSVNQQQYPALPQSANLGTMSAITPHPLRIWFSSLESISETKLAIKDTIVNDIPLRVYVPLNSVPHLEVGRNIVNKREETLMFLEAADVRADNGKIVGAFVLKGESHSKGLSKRGYCAIINKKVSIGVAENSPLFEQATELNGDFFRQYPLVDNGELVENELKNKSIRKALCDIDNHIAIVETQTRESLHDFAQALVDIGTYNAIYLVGGDAMGWTIDKDGKGHKIGNWSGRQHKNINFIVWPK